MNFRQPPSKYKNQILTALKRDSWQSELDLTRDAIGNDAASTIQANHDTIIFSCGNGVGFVASQEPAKYGFQHTKINCGSVSDIRMNPYLPLRLVAISSVDKTVRIYRIAKPNEEQSTLPIHEFRASDGTANTPVLLCWNPQVSGILAIASGSKIDLFSISSGRIEITLDIKSPVLGADWAHEGSVLFAISRDGMFRTADLRKQDITQEVKITCNKPIVKALSQHSLVISSLSRMREREVNLYSTLDPSKVIKSWNFGTASTPLLPIVDQHKRICYLLDKSGATLRWIETFAPYNEGACSTSVDQCSSGCLIHPFGLKLMEGEINRLLIADTKGNVVPVKISIGRKSYLEFHDDLFTDIEVESSITESEWMEGKDLMAKRVKINPTVVQASIESGALSTFAFQPTAESTSKEPKADTKAKSSQPSTRTQVNDAVSSPPKLQPSGVQTGSSLSRREERQWDKQDTSSNQDESLGRRDESARDKDEPSSRQVSKEDLHARRAEYGVPKTSELNSGGDSPRNSVHKEAESSVSVEQQEGEDTFVGRGPPPTLDDEDVLEAMRARKVTPAIEQITNKSIEIQSPQPVREVYREDLGARRQEYGVSSTGTREVFKENLGERRSEYGANAKSLQMSSTKNENDIGAEQGDGASGSGSRDIYGENLMSRRQEYGAPSRINTKTSPQISSKSAPILSAREQRRWDKETGSSPSPIKQSESTRPGSTKTSATKTAGSPPPPKKVERISTAEREIYREDLSARRAEYGATPTLDGPTTASKEMSKALHKASGSIAQTDPNVLSELEPYQAKDTLEPAPQSPTKEELENVYALPDSAPSPSSVLPEATKPVVHEAPQQEDTTKEPEHLLLPSQTEESGQASQNDTIGLPSPVAQKEYTRKYLTGKTHHPRNSFTSLSSLNSSLPNTARMIDATSTHILVPLAGPGGRIGIISSSNPGRLPPLINALMGGATVADFELDRFQTGRCVSAHVDQAVRIWQIPDLSHLESDVEKPIHTIKGLDRILSLSFHPYTKGLLLITTVAKLHIFDIDAGDEIKVIPVRGLANSCWSLDGTKIGLGLSDKSVKILEAHTGDEIISFPSAHHSTRPFRIAFVAANRLITAGFGRGSTRQVTLYDTNSGSELQTIDLDISPSPFSLPSFDDMTSVLYLIPRGTSAILPFHVTADSLTALTSFTASDPVMGTSFLPPQLLDVREVEVARCLRLTTNEVTIVGFYIPRPSGDFFQDDIYPSHVRDAYTPSLAVKEWKAGERPVKYTLYNMNVAGLRSSSAAVSLGKKSGVSAAKGMIQKETETKKESELEEMFKKAKGQDGDEPDFQNNASNTRWE